MDGGPDFFRVTKAFHNALHGDPYRSSRDDFDIFLEYNARNRESIALDSEFVVVHDPQPAALIDARKEHAGHWIWRCHIDLSRPNDAVWQFLERYVSRYDAAIFSSPAFSRQLSLPQYLFYPSIDPLADKNRPLDDEVVDTMSAGGKRCVLQVTFEPGYEPSELDFKMLQAGASLGAVMLQLTDAG